MNDEALVVTKTNSVKIFDEMLEEMKLINKHLSELKSNKQDEILTRKEVQKLYKISERATMKIFNVLLKEKVINIGREQKIAKEHIDELFRKGVVLK